MIKLTDVLASACGLLASNYDLPVYDNNVKEGFDKPSFFVQIISKGITNVSTFSRKYAFSIVITYFQDIPDSIDNMEKVNEISTLFGNSLTLNDGAVINLSDFDYDLVGNDSNILQISIETEFYDAIEQTNEYEEAEKLTINNELER